MGCDLQTKLPFLIRAVTGSLAKEGWPAAPNMFPKNIKLEYEDDKCSLADPYMDSDSAHQQFAKSKLPVWTPSPSQVVTSGAKAVEAATFKTPGNSTKTGMMHRAMTAITGGRRQLKI